MMAGFAIKSNRVLLPDGLQPATVVVQGELIESIHPHDFTPPDLPLIDVGHHSVLPGLVDCHVHINEPGRTEWEGFETATQAAAAGGICSVVDMPLNCQPVTTRPEALSLKLEATRGQLWVDMGFWGGVVPDNADALVPLAKDGILGAKAFLIHSGIDDFPEVNEEQLRAAMVQLKSCGLPLLAHAELDLGAPADDLAPITYESYLRSRPPEWETRAIELLVNLCRETGCAVHIVHLSAAEALPTLRAARAEGLPITVETCPHYLCLEAETIPDRSTSFKCAPPIRGKANQDRLWEGLREGVIDFIVSDHSPCVPQLKCFDSGNFHDAWGGISSLQLGISSVWEQAQRRGFTEIDLVRWMSTGPAEFIGRSGTLGRLAPGYYANMVVWDPECVFEVTAEHLLFRHRVSPFIGRRIQGKVLTTYLRGQRIYHEGELAQTPQGVHLLHRETTSSRRSNT